MLGSVYPRWLRIGLAAGVAVCAVLSLGVRDVTGLGAYLTPYRLLYEIAPGWDGVRTPGRINTLTSLGLALLAGAGLCVLLRYARRRAGPSRWAAGHAAPLAGGVLLVGAILGEGLGPLAHPRVPPPPPGQRLASHLSCISRPASTTIWSTATGRSTAFRRPSTAPGDSIPMVRPAAEDHGGLPRRAFRVRVARARRTHRRPASRTGGGTSLEDAARGRSLSFRWNVRSPWRRSLPARAALTTSPVELLT